MSVLMKFFSSKEEGFNTVDNYEMLFQISRSSTRYFFNFVFNFFYAFNISGTIQPQEDKSIVITPWTEITRRHTNITLNRYHRSLIHHWPHGDTVSLVRNILR